MKKKFILGVGAQKTGTSWLYRNLKKNKQFNFGLTKEYHIWDAKFLSTCKNFLVKDQNNLTKLQKVRLKMHEIEGFYEDYFLSIINNEKYITGDMTPSYSMLNEKHFKYIKKKLDVNFDIKVILILRDPIDRVWSQMKMERKFRLNKGFKMSEKELVSEFEFHHSKEKYFDRSNYISTLKSLNVFEKKQILILFYDNLFNHKSVNKICKFLNVNDLTFNFKRINSSENLLLPKTLRKLAMTSYSKIIDYCIKEFPEIEEFWGY